MESTQMYLDRKYEELVLLRSFLSAPSKMRYPKSVAEVIEQKFHFSAALKAEHALRDWAQTETAWTRSAWPRSGPFEFRYDYQRADLEVRGPSFYALDKTVPAEIIYTSSGMAAISALLMATALVLSEAEILLLPHTYVETIELIDSHARHLKPVTLAKSPAEIISRGSRRPRILLLDSCTLAAAFDATLECASASVDLVIFDTTCFSSGSGRIARVLRWARRAALPLVLVRSHTKLDSLGVEYGRLGSALFVGSRDESDRTEQKFLQSLSFEMRKAVRLFGCAALPAHFPPYVGAPAYRTLTDRRVAAMLRNNRRTARLFSTMLAGLSAELHYAHGLYVTLACSRRLDENKVREVTAELCAGLDRTGLPLRHAGSFGFDFGAAEWGRDRSRDRYVVRIAVPDLPTALWDEYSRAIATWWAVHGSARSYSASS
jgi:hypothetical protein